MRTPSGRECKYFYADYFRGKETQECRLLGANPASDAWKPALCQTCPVPAILLANACPNLVMRARVGKSSTRATVRERRSSATEPTSPV